jgi:enamine deaminase RidA (YjgF/YER057c/UK114 family)
MSQAVAPEGWQPPRGYSYGMVTESTRRLHVAGQIGMDMRTGEMAEGFAAQWARALSNVVAVVTAAGGRAEDIVALRVFVTDIGRYQRSLAETAEAWASTMGQHLPAASLVQVTALIVPEAFVEMEAEAALQ